jgi:hypothetical protein
VRTKISEKGGRSRDSIVTHQHMLAFAMSIDTMRAYNEYKSHL